MFSTIQQINLQLIMLIHQAASSAILLFQPLILAIMTTNNQAPESADSEALARSQTPKVTRECLLQHKVQLLLSRTQA